MCPHVTCIHLSTCALADNCGCSTLQIEALADPARDFELSPAALPAAPKWGRACDWTPRDDAMLLLGVYRYGIDHWDRCACWAAVALVKLQGLCRRPPRRQPLGAL